MYETLKTSTECFKDRKRPELQLMGRPKLQSTPAPEHLTEKELENLVEEIKKEHVYTEEQDPDS